VSGVALAAGIWRKRLGYRPDPRPITSFMNATRWCRVAGAKDCGGQRTHPRELRMKFLPHSIWNRGSPILGGVDVALPGPDQSIGWILPPEIAPTSARRDLLPVVESVSRLPSAA